MKRLFAPGKFTGRNTIAFSMLNTTAFAPIPNASVRIAVTANPGDFLNFRIATVKSLVILAAFAFNYGSV